MVATVVDVEVLAGEEVVIEVVAEVLEEEVVAEVRIFMLYCGFYLNGSMRMRQCLKSKLLTLPKGGGDRGGRGGGRGGRGAPRGGRGAPRGRGGAGAKGGAKTIVVSI